MLLNIEQTTAAVAGNVRLSWHRARLEVVALLGGLHVPNGSAHRFVVKPASRTPDVHAYGAGESSGARRATKDVGPLFV
jgi:hypothetical protein